MGADRRRPATRLGPVNDALDKDIPYSVRYLVVCRPVLLAAHLCEPGPDPRCFRHGLPAGYGAPPIPLHDAASRAGGRPWAVAVCRLRHRHGSRLDASQAGRRRPADCLSLGMRPLAGTIRARRQNPQPPVLPLVTPNTPSETTSGG